MNLKNFMTATQFRITEGSEYSWRCYGPNAYQIDAWNQSVDGYSAGIIFDTKTQVVYEVTLCDYNSNRAYRWFNPDFKVAHNDEADSRGCSKDEAWDDVNFVDIDVDEDILEKITKRFNNETYDTRVMILIDLPDDLMLEAMKIAHSLDLTFNQFVEKVLQDYINQQKERE